MRRKVNGVLLISGLLTILLINSVPDEPKTAERMSTVPLESTEAIAVEVEPLDIETVTEAAPELISLGVFRLTAYCSCYECCGKWANNRPDGIVYGASGKELTANHSIAVDPEIIPYGTTVIINGTEYVSEDCGGSISNNRIDIYFDKHEDALEFGVQYAEIFIESED